MFLSALEIKNFKKLKNTRIEFPGDVTVLRGNNEAGKSTTIKALTSALFDDPTISPTPKYVEANRRWNSSQLYQLNLYFEAEGEEHVIEKDFEAKSVLMKDGNTGDVISHSYDQIAKKLEELGGYRNKELFKHFSVIRQDELNLLKSEKKKIKESLQDMMAGSATSTSVSSLTKKLQKTIDTLTKGYDTSRPVKNVGRMKMTEERISELNTLIEEKRAALEKKDKARVREEELKREIDEKESEKEVLEKEHAMSDQYFKVHKEKERMNQELDQIMKDIEAYEKLEKQKSKLEEEYNELKSPGEDDIDRIEQINQRVASLEERMNEHEERILNLQKHDKKAYYPARTPTLTIGGGLFLLGFLGFVYTPLFSLWGILLVFVGLMFATGKYWEAKQVKELKKERSSLEERHKEAKKELEEALKEYDVSSVEELKNVNKTIQAKLNEIKQVESQEEGLLRGRSIDQLHEKKRELEKQIAVEDAKITEEQKNNPPTAKRQREIESELKELEKQIEKAKNQYQKEKAQMESVDVSHEELIELEEKRAVAQKDLEDMKRRAKIYSIILGTIEDAQKESITKTKGALEEMIGEYLSEITGGRYNAARLSDDFDVEVYSPEKEEYISSEELSTGTVDQLYIVARFALVNMLYNTGQKDKEKFLYRPTIILDDPFGNFDEERRERIKHLLEHLGQDFQIMLFTANGDYDSWGSLVKFEAGD